MYIADRYNHRIRTYNPVTKLVGTLAGSGTQGFADGTATTAKFDNPSDVAVDSNGAVYVADNGNHAVRRVYNGQVTTIAGNGTSGTTDGQQATSQLKNPSGVAVYIEPPNSNLTIYIADTGNHRMRGAIYNSSVGWTVHTLVGSSEGYYDGAYNLAKFAYPGMLAVAGTGAQRKIFVTELGSSNLIRLISTTAVSTFAGVRPGGFADGPATAAKFYGPGGLVTTAVGDLYVADGINHRLRLVANGQVSTFAGTGAQGLKDGPLNTAQFAFPSDIALAPNGTLYVADKTNHRIRAVIP